MGKPPSSFNTLHGTLSELRGVAVNVSLLNGRVLTGQLANVAQVHRAHGESDHVVSLVTSDGSFVLFHVSEVASFAICDELLRADVMSCVILPRLVFLTISTVC